LPVPFGLRTSDLAFGATRFTTRAKDSGTFVRAQLAREFDKRFGLFRWRHARLIPISCHAAFYPLDVVRV